MNQVATPLSVRGAQLKQLQARRVELTRNACETATPSPAFIAASKKISDPIDWLMWMYPANAGAFIHGLDRLMLGDATAEAQVAAIREEMGL